MKKFLSIFLSLILFCFSSCAPPLENQNENIQSENSLSINTTSFSNHEEDNAEINGETDAVRGLLINFRSLEEYNKEIDSCTVPQTFVAYSDISDFGDFSIFSLSKESPSYSYRFQENEFRISLYIDHDPPLYLKPEPHNLKLLDIKSLPLDAPDDLRLYSATLGNEHFIHDDIIYHYKNGRLFSIKWYVENVEFYLIITTLDPEDNLERYVLHLYDGNTPIINALLNKNTAGSVKLAFDNMMAKKAEAAK